MVSPGTALVSAWVSVRVHCEFTTLHIILPLFVTGGVTGVPRCSEGMRTVPTVAASLNCTNIHSGKEEIKKKTTKKTKNCSPVTRHLVMTWPLRFKQHTQAHFDRTHSSSLSTHTRTQYSIQCTSPIHTKLRP